MSSPQAFDPLYAAAYDLLYRDKNYAAETDFILKILREAALPKQGRILELGSGTGIHASLLAEQGYSVTGTDLSESMIARANARAAELSTSTASRLRFLLGDARSFRCEEKAFDAVISLFHVASYQTTNADLVAYFQTARHHLKPGGIFLFDAWWGPAVLTDRPATRVKRLRDDRIELVRLAEPRLFPTENRVDVHYEVRIREAGNPAAEWRETHEVHPMRYLFQPEVELLLSQAGLKLEWSGEWLTEKAPDFSSWGVAFLARAL